MTFSFLKRTSIGAAMLSGALVATMALHAPTPASAEDELTVALYPWVPRPEQFVDAVSAAWAEVQPDVELNIIMDGDVWDGGYHTPVQETFDVFVFDAMYFNDFYNQELLEPIDPSEVVNPDDFVAYARDGVMRDGNFMALPLLGCANILFYPTDDEALANATTLAQVNAALGQCTYTSEIPPDRRGIMVDMSGTTSTSTIYLDILYSQTGDYPPPLQLGVDGTALTAQRQLLRVASVLNAVAETDNPYQRAAWYNGGYGQSWMGYTESLSQLSADERNQIAFKPMPLGYGTEPPLFYADVAAVNTATVARGTRDLAVQLANVVTATDTVVASIGDGTYGQPQFLMAARNSAFAALADQDPIYIRLAALLETDPLMFVLDADVREWLNTVGHEVRTDVMAAPQCGCDFVTPTPITSNAAAPAICNPVCADHGGWNGQWTNQPPAPAPSVCGCNACAVDAVQTAVDPTPSPND